MRRECWVNVSDLNKREVFSFKSVKDTVEYLMDNFNLSRMKAQRKLYNSFKEETPLFGMYFTRNPEYVHSKPVVATNLITGELIFKSSVGKMGEHFFGKEDEQAEYKISEAIQTGEIINGFSFTFENHKGFENVYPRSELDTSKKPVYQIDIHSGRLIRFHPCITSAAKKLREESVISF